MKNFILLGTVCLLVTAGFFLLPDRKSITTKSSFPHEEYALASQYGHYGEGLKEYKQAVLSELKRLKKTRNANAAWKMEGPLNTGGRINSIALTPGVTNSYLVGCADGGIFKTTNGGSSWEPIFDQAYALSVSCVVYEPNNAQVVYAGTGDQVLGGYSHLGNGIYRSTNGGLTWTNIGLSNHGAISKIVIDPSNPNTIYAGTTGNPFITDNNRGLYKTTDGGVTWNQILFLGQNAGIGDLVISPGNTNRVFCTGRRRIRSNTNSVITGPEAKIYRSTNGGASWDTLQTGLPTGIQCRIGLAISNSNPDKVYANYINDSLNYSGLYRTMNGGDSWTAINTNPASVNTGGFGWYFGQIRLDPTNDNKILLLGVNLTMSINGGNTFTALGTTHSDKHDVVFINPSTFLVATDGGLYRTTNTGTSFTLLNNIPITQFYRVAYNPLTPGNYYGGAQDNGSNVGSAASGLNNWMRYYGADGFQPAFDTTDVNTYYAEWQNGNIMATIDDGWTWDNISSSIIATDRCSWNTPYFVSTFNNLHLYAGSYRVYKNTFGPYDQWLPISSDLTNGTNNTFHVITALHQSTLNASRLYAGTSDARVWTTGNDGSSWTQINTGLPNRYVSCVKASPNFPNAVCVTLSGYRDNDTMPHIYYSTNNGATWTSIAGNLPNFPINDVWIYGEHQDSCMVVANDGGVYATQDLGQNWFRVGNNMPIIPVYDVEFNHTEQRLFVGTFARSMQSMSIDSVFTSPTISVNVSTQTKLNLVSVFPNPTNGLFTLQSEQVNVDWIIADVFGRPVKKFRSKEKNTIVDIQEMAAGSYMLYAPNSKQKAIPITKTR